METATTTTTSNNEDDDDVVFLDALDDFPFYDCLSSLAPQSECSTLISASASSPSSSSSSAALFTADSSSTLRRRSFSRRSFSGDDSKTSSFNSSTFRERYRLSRNLAESENINEKPEPVQSENSVVTTETDNRVVAAAVANDSADSAAELSDPSFNWLIFIAGLVIKAITFQINLFITFTTFPLFLLYHSYTVITNPYQTARRGTDYLSRKLSKFKPEALSSWLRENQWVWKVAVRCGWGILSSAYVGVVLCSLLVSSAVFSVVLVRCLVEEPIRIKEVLNFNYAKPSPVAYVPIVPCTGIGCGEHCKELIGGIGFIPPTHRLQVMVSLTLPESEYNRNLGVFQVRVDFLSASGKTLASSSHPCMLQFKSEPIRLLLTFLKAAPLVAGYVSESQTLNLKFRGFTEGEMPTACLKVTIEQRAEYRPGAGIPELYDASLILESELPLFKRIIWYWKKTIFIWISIMSFMMQLLFTLVCCRSIIIPKARPRDVVPSNSATRNSPPVQGGVGGTSATGSSSPVQG
ncbi:seipin-2-like [Castanea sativa]|uniref:seipin-2-like n=1 Tax=Castanea sativa TaxID=21020 RepID=UPI003F6508C1